MQCEDRREKSEILERTKLHGNPSPIWRPAPRPTSRQNTGGPAWGSRASATGWKPGQTALDSGNSQLNWHDGRDLLSSRPHRWIEEGRIHGRGIQVARLGQS